MSQRIQGDLRFYQDLQGLNNLKGAVDKPAALEQAAGQFEVQFLQMVLKNMRAAGDALADEESLASSQQQHFYREMYDSQLALALAGKQNLGLKESMLRQLAPGTEPVPNPANPTGAEAFRQSLLTLPKTREPD